MISILLAIWIVLVGFGGLYAWYIKENPIKPTWVSVAIGTGAICLAEMGSITTILYHYNLLSELWWMVLIPPVALLTPGLPMSLIQQKKWEKMTEDNEEIIQILTNDE